MTLLIPQGNKGTQSACQCLKLKSSPAARLKTAQGSRRDSWTPCACDGLGHCEVTFYPADSRKAGLSLRALRASSGKETEILVDFPPLAIPSYHLGGLLFLWPEHFLIWQLALIGSSGIKLVAAMGTAEPKIFVAKVAFMVFKWLGNCAIRENFPVASPCRPLGVMHPFSPRPHT